MTRTLQSDADIANSDGLDRIRRQWVMRHHTKLRCLQMNTPRLRKTSGQTNPERSIFSWLGGCLGKP